jgi:hypothetical protein
MSCRLVRGRPLVSVPEVVCVYIVVDTHRVLYHSQDENREIAATLGQLRAVYLLVEKVQYEYRWKL